MRFNGLKNDNTSSGAYKILMQKIGFKKLKFKLSVKFSKNINCLNKV